MGGIKVEFERRIVMTQREIFEKMLISKHMVDNADEIVEVVTDFLLDQINQLKQREPKPLTTLRELETARKVIWDMFDEI